MGNPVLYYGVPVPHLFLCYMLYKHSAGIRSVVDDEAGKSNGGLKSDPMCNACEMAVVWMQNQLAQNKTQELILNYINQASLTDPEHRGVSVPFSMLLCLTISL